MLALKCLLVMTFTAARAALTEKNESKVTSGSYNHSINSLDFITWNKNIVEWVILILQLCMPFGLVIIAYVSYIYIKKYTTVVTFDNFYVTHQFKLIDKLKFSHDDDFNQLNETFNNGGTAKKTRLRNFDNTCAGPNDDGWQSGHPLLPLKNYEKLFMVDATRWSLSGREKGMAKSGMCTAILLASLTFLLYAVDISLYLLLRNCSSKTDDIYERSGGRSLESMVEGNGILAQIIDLFLRNLHPTRWFKFNDDQLTDFNSSNKTYQEKVKSLEEKASFLCQSQFFSFSLPIFVNIIFFELAFLTIVLTKAKLFRLRNSIVGYFYEDVQKIRINYLFDALSKQRSNLQAILNKVVRTNHDKHHSFYQPKFSSIRTNAACLIKECHNNTQYTKQQNRPINFFYNIYTKFKQKLCFSKLKCYVCNGYSSQLVLCPTQNCCGSYCESCYGDLCHTCPLCSFEDSNSSSIKIDS